MKFSFSKRGLHLKILLSLLTTILCLVFLEIIGFLLNRGRPAIINVGLPEERYGLVRYDPLLSWSLLPNQKIITDKGAITTNAIGLRSPHVPKGKESKEIRILSLGESTTFGTGVGDRQTYSFKLEQILNEKKSAEFFRVINAGVFAYSSTQSLIFLKERGLRLEPDVVLFYHELNDYLPSTLQGSHYHSTDIMKTDWEIYHARNNKVIRWLLAHSQIIGYFSDKLTWSKIHQCKINTIQNPLSKIGLPNLFIPSRLVKKTSDGLNRITANENLFGRRVTDEERQQNLKDLLQLSLDKNFKLILIHPSYRDSIAHSCLLTEFAKQNAVPMVDAHSCFNKYSNNDNLFIDSWHPAPQGHTFLAECLKDAILHSDTPKK